MESNRHKEEIVDQFTNQAIPFAELKAHSEDRTLDIFRELGDFSGTERVLDSGCGPGLVSCYLTSFANDLIGLDLTPVMVQLANETAAKRSITNVQFIVGNMLELPFPKDHFDVSISRYAFHHLENPQIAFAEMLRVTKPGGKVIVLDATPEEMKQAAYNKFEILRDPSHTKAWTPQELSLFGKEHGLASPKTISFRLEMDANQLVESSFPKAASREHLLQLLMEDVDQDSLSFRVCQKESRLTVFFPLTAVCWQAPL
jgi:ubiquinone/menaquinone biosynthesis C-methylase UbiE